MSVAGRALTGLFGALGIPLAWLVVQQGFATGWVAVVLLVLYEVVILLGAIVASVAQQVVRRRIEQVMDVVDLAFGRRVSRYARYYRRYVLERDGHINARDLAHTPSHIPELDAVYVDVGLAPGSPSGRSGGLLPASRVDQARRQSIHDFLDKERPAVCAVIGAPGSGKSTLLRHTARLAASQSKERRRRVPVMLALRDHADALTDDPSRTLAQLIRADVGTLSVAEPGGWWESQLRGGNCLILLDGLDEIARSEHRAAIAEWIENQIAKHPKNDFVITSRPHGYQTAVIPKATVLQVRPFTTEQIRQFVHGWCRAAERLATGASGPEIDLRAQEEAEDLIGQLSSTPALMELAVNPLLLTMMVLVHRERRSLPAGRADLYNQVCDVMLWRRQESKKLEVKPPGAIRQRILAALAYDMMVAETRDYPKSQVLEIFDRSLQQLDADISAEDLLTALVETSGLLVEREKDLYSFAHHTIGEYLASAHIRSKNLIATLIRSVGDPWWRETTLLYVTDADANDIVEACLARNTGASLALAFDCVRSHGQLSLDLRISLNHLRERAFSYDASSEHRRLVASAISSGHLSSLIADDNGALICPHPIPEVLYRLFCMDTGAPLHDGDSGMRDLDSPYPAAGIWRQDAEAFVAWMNQVVAQENEPTFRLLTVSEVEFTKSSGSPGIRLDRINAAIWTMEPEPGSVPEIWTADGTDPFEISGKAVHHAVATDLIGKSILFDFLLAGALVDANAIAHTLNQAVARHLSVQGVAQLAEDLLRSIKLVHNVARDLDGYAPIRPGLDIDLILARAEGLTHDDFRNGSLTYSRQIIHRLTETLDYPNLFAPSFTVPYSVGFQNALSYNEARTVMRVKALGTALAEALRDVEMASGSELSEIVTTSLLGSGKLSSTWDVSVDLDALLGTLRSACATLSLVDSRSAKYQRAEFITSRLLRDAEPLLARAHPSVSKDFANLRILALMASAEAISMAEPELADDFNYLVAGITLLEKRAADYTPLETILLARE